MTGRLVLAAVLSAFAAYGQLQLFTFDGTTEKPVTPTTDLGTVPAGDSRDMRFRARNNTAAAITLQTVALAGTGFTITSAPSLPFVVAPTNFVEVRVRFSTAALGSYSATLAVNSTQTLLRANVVASATISLLNNSTATLLASGATLDFGRVQKGQSVVEQLRIANGTDVTLMTQSCGISGDVCHGPALQCPLSLAPGAAVTVSVSFDPKVAGSQTATLSFDTRSFALVGVGFDPPLPQPRVTFDSPLSSGTQQRLAIQLASIAESSGDGTVSLEFQPASTIMGDDPAIVFTSTGARNLSFQVKEGAQTGAFPSGVDTVFQTGTTAGVIIFHVQLGAYNDAFQFPIAPAAISVDHATALRRVSDLDVSVTGFDNTRTAGRFGFTFFDKNGNTVQPGTIRADWSDTFSNYFRTSKVGGSFTMRATFPVSGDASQIAGVEVEMTNSAGTMKTSRLSF
jgi:hypothetical protein